MSKAAHYLQEHLAGEVFATSNMRQHFSTDGSIFTVTPALIVYPRNENDVRKAARFTWQLAERGRVIPITPRGAGTNQSGAAIGSGIIMSFPAHMNKILEFDGKTGVVTVEPGINYGKLQQALHTHGRFLPPFPASLEYSSMGGAIATNTGGSKALKYGPTRKFVKSLRVVLANGEAIETKRLNKRELSKKLGLSTFEGEIYRALDTLLEENHEAVKKSRLAVSKNTAGYNLADIKRRDGSFDLASLLVGAQGTLGIITEAVLETEPNNPSTTLIAGFCDDIKVAQEIIVELSKLPDTPSSVEVIDGTVLEMIEKHNPNLLGGIVDKPLPRLVLLIEFDNPSPRVQKSLGKKAKKILEKYEVAAKIEADEIGQERLRKIHHSVAAVLATAEGNLQPVPVIDDGIVPLDRLAEYFELVAELFKKQHLRGAVWGHGGDANLHIRPFLDLSQVGDRQKVFRLLDDYYGAVIGLGGSTSGEHNDGRLRAPYLKALYGEDVYLLFQKVKQIFDPYGTLNPGVKINVTHEDIKPLLRYDYNLANLYQHLA
jgi:FAD/FMN-containing dehydrogenase